MDNCNESISWKITYEGGLAGCMDIEACNYNPLASEQGVCYYNDDPNCPEGAELESEMYGFVLQTEQITDHCKVEEGCTQGYGERELFRFTT